jgi:hypothetical protein
MSIFTDPIYSNTSKQDKLTSEYIPNLKQQNRLIAAFKIGTVEGFNKDPMSINPQDRDDIIRAIASNKITEANLSEIIKHIIPPHSLPDRFQQELERLEREEKSGTLLNPQELDNLRSLRIQKIGIRQELFLKVSESKQIKEIISHFVLNDMSKRDLVSFENFMQFLERFPEPTKLMQEITPFLDGIEASNSPQKRKEYEKSLNDFMTIIYGKRFEYFQQFQLLKQEAKNRASGNFYPQPVEIDKGKVGIRSTTPPEETPQNHDSPVYFMAPAASENPSELTPQEKDRLLQKEFLQLFNGYTEVFQTMERDGHKVEFELLFDNNFRYYEAHNQKVVNAQKNIINLKGRTNFSEYILSALRVYLTQKYVKKYPENRSISQESVRQIQEVRAQKVESKESEKIIQKINILGKAYNGESLTINLLKKEGFTPKFKVVVGETTYWLPDSTYDSGSGRLAITAYVEQNGQLTACSFYRSLSQSAWRYLPDYRVNSSGVVDHYGKGYDQSSITLPIALQKALSGLSNKGFKFIKPKSDPTFLFTGTVKPLGSRDNPYYKDTDTSPLIISNKISRNIPPESSDVVDNKRQAPDFSNLIDSWVGENTMYGKVTYEVFSSRDGNLKYLFCRDSRGRAWIAHIEDNSPIQTTGLRKSWVLGGSLLTPAYEYIDESLGYGTAGSENGNYIDIYQNYLSKVPIIREYITRFGGIERNPSNSIIDSEPEDDSKKPGFFSRIFGS